MILNDHMNEWMNNLERNIYTGSLVWSNRKIMIQREIEW